MKRFILSLFLLSGAYAQPAPVAQIDLFYDYPTNSITTNLVINYYRAPVVTGPFVQFTNAPMMNAVSTNGTNATFKLSLSVVPGQMFYYSTTSNTFWRVEGPPSNTAGTDPLPVAGSNLRITRP